MKLFNRAKNSMLLPMVLVAVVVSPLSMARADWQADVQIRAGDMSSKGKAFFQKTRMRVDTEMKGMPASMLIDMKAQSMTTLLHAQKMMMKSQMDLSKMSVPACESGDAEACLAKQGFKKVGSETVNGYACTVYEGQVSNGKQGAKIRLWRPNTLKEVMTVRTVVSSLDGKGQSSTSDFTNVKVGPVPDSTFAVPAGYQALPDMTKMMQGME